MPSAATNDTTANPPEYAKPLSLTWIPGDKLSSFGGAGTLEILEVIKILENADICSMLVGISALNYYGAPRIRLVCSSSSSVSASSFLISHSRNGKFACLLHCLIRQLRF